MRKVDDSNMENPAFDSKENNVEISHVSHPHQNNCSKNQPPTLKNNSGKANGTSQKVTSPVKNGSINPDKDKNKDEDSKGIQPQRGYIGSFTLVLGTMIGAISFVELGTVVPPSGAEYAYLLKAFGHLPAFLFSWTSSLVLKPASVAIGCISVAEYSIDPFVSNISDVPWACKLLSIVFIFVLTFINCYSVKIATQIQVVFTITKLLAFGTIICGGVVNICNGKTEHLKFGLQGSKWNYGKLASGTFQGLWAFDGWSQLTENYITGQIKDPTKHLPVAIMLSLPMITVLYILVNIAYLTLLTPYEVMSVNNSVTTLYGERLLGPLSFLMPILVILSTFGTALSNQYFGAARLTSIASQEGHLVNFLSFVDLQRRTPSLALIFNSLIAILMALTLDLSSLIQFFCFTSSIFYGGKFSFELFSTMFGGVAALIRLRYTEPNAPRPFKVPIIIPYFTVLASIYLAIAPFVEDIEVEYICSVAFLTVGLILYFPFIHYELVLPGMSTVTRNLQILFLTAPSTIEMKVQDEKMPSNKPKKKADELESSKNSNIQITRL